MRDAVYALLSTDPTLMGILTGGLYDGREAGEIGRSDTPDAFDGSGEIQPCGLLRFTTDAPYGPYETSARVYFSILLYERSNYVNVEAARARLYPGILNMDSPKDTSIYSRRVPLPEAVT